MLGDRIESTALDVLELLIGATFTKARDAKLAEANLGLERLRYFMRLSFELRLIDARIAPIHARSGGITVLPGVPMLRSGVAMMSEVPSRQPPDGGVRFGPCGGGRRSCPMATMPV